MKELHGATTRVCVCMCYKCVKNCSLNNNYIIKEL